MDMKNLKKTGVFLVLVIALAFFALRYQLRPSDTERVVLPDNAAATSADTNAANLESPAIDSRLDTTDEDRIVEGYDDLLSADKSVRDGAFQMLFDQMFRDRNEGFDFLANPEKLVSALSKTLLSDDNDTARMSTHVIRHIATVSGSAEVARERGFDQSTFGLTEHYRQFEKFEINDTLNRLATEAEGSIQEDAVVAIYVQDVMSEKNDDLLIRTFRSPKTDDRTLSTLLMSLAGTVYIPPGENYTKRPIARGLASAVYELLSYDSDSRVRSLASKVLAYSGSVASRDVVIEGLIGGPNDDLFERSLSILKQHSSKDLKQDQRLQDVVNSLQNETQKSVFNEFVQSLE